MTSFITRSNVTITAGGPGVRKKFFALNSMLDLRESARRAAPRRPIIYLFEGDESPAEFKIPIEITDDERGSWEVIIYHLAEFAAAITELTPADQKQKLEDFQSYLTERAADSFIYVENPLGWVTAMPAALREDFLNFFREMIIIAQTTDGDHRLNVAVNSLVDFAVIDDPGRLGVSGINQNYNYFLFPNPNDSFYLMMARERGVDLQGLFITEAVYLPVGLAAIEVDTARWLNEA